MSDPAVSGSVQAATLGGGQYNEYSAAQHAAAKGALALLPQAMAAVRPSLPVKDGAETGAAVTVVDYGCSEGKNSVRHMTAILDALRSTAGGGLTTRTPVTVVHNDQPHNDWASLTRSISLSPLGSTLRDNVFSLLSPRSFYRQILPNNSVHVGWASASSHWLSALPPARLPNAVFSYAETDSHAKEVWRHYAEHDWQAFLAARASELVTGGVLLLSCLLSEPPADYSPPIGEDEPLWKILRRLERAGQLSNDDLHRLNLPTYYRTREETCGDAVLKAHGLQLLACETRLFRDSPPKIEFRRHGDAALFAQQQAGILRTTGSAMFVAAFGQAKAEMFFQQLEAFIREDPDCCDFYLPMGFLLLQKKSSAAATQPSDPQQQQPQQPPQPA